MKSAAVSVPLGTQAAVLRKREASIVPEISNRTKLLRGPIPETMTLDVACDILCSQHGISHATSRVIVSGIGPQNYRMYISIIPNTRIFRSHKTLDFEADVYLEIGVDKPSKNLIMHA